MLTNIDFHDDTSKVKLREREEREEREKREKRERPTIRRFLVVITLVQIMKASKPPSFSLVTECSSRGAFRRATTLYYYSALAIVILLGFMSPLARGRGCGMFAFPLFGEFRSGFAFNVNIMP
jgi:hypothetical protein